MTDCHKFLLKLCIFSLAFTSALVSQTNPDNPDRTIGLLRNEPGAFPGYTLFAPIGSLTAYLIDMDGNLVHSWEGEYHPDRSVYLLDNGNLLRTCTERARNRTFNERGSGGRIQEMDWEGNIVWDYLSSTPEYLSHHDIERMPNGNTLIIAWELITRDEALAAGRNTVSDELEHVWADMILEVKKTGPATGEIVWEWRTWDHLSSESGGTANGRPVSADIKDPGKININIGPQRARPDLFHFNAIDYNEQLDQIIVSSNVFSELFVIDHSTADYNNPAAGIEAAAGPAGDILYRWGKPANYASGAAADAKLFAVHDPHWIEPGLKGAGNILIFNNGMRRRSEDYSSVLEIVPPLSGGRKYDRISGSKFGPEEPVWSYAAEPKSDFYSQNISGAQRLPNGNTLICSGAKGRFFEVTTEGKIVWEYINPVSAGVPQPQGTKIQRNHVFRAYRFGADFPGLAGRDLTPQGRIELPTKK